MTITHILFQLPTEADVMRFLALGGNCILDPDIDEEPSDELIAFLKYHQLWEDVKDAKRTIL